MTLFILSIYRYEFYQHAYRQKLAGKKTLIGDLWSVKELANNKICDRFTNGKSTIFFFLLVSFCQPSMNMWNIIDRETISNSINFYFFCLYFPQWIWHITDKKDCTEFQRWLNNDNICSILFQLFEIYWGNSSVGKNIGNNWKIYIF